MKKYICAFFLAGSVATVNAQETPNYLIYDDANWRITAREANVEEFLDRQSLKLTGGRVWRDDVNFHDGVIEFDVAFDERMGFIGPIFRAERDDRFEEFYFRSHLNGKPDALQYSPVENGLSAWQIFSDANALAAIPLKFGEWNRVKIVVEGDKADFYFNADTPQLHVPDLKTDIANGYVGLRAGGPDNMFAHFSNISFRPLTNGEGVIGAEKETASPPGGLISEWRVSEPFAEAEVANVLTLGNEIIRNLDWKPLRVETNGIANLAKLSTAADGADTVFVRLNIKSDSKQMKELRFGYSDRVRFYLNGKRVYYGDAGWRVRDYRFLGTVGFFDSVGLDLKKGDNELRVAVSETFGGWAFVGAMEDQIGVELKP